MIKSIKMNRLLKIGEAAKILGITVQTLRRWEKDGSFLPDKKSAGGTRYYEASRLLGGVLKESSLT